ISHYKINVANYAQSTGPLLLIRPRVIGALAVHIEYKDRKYDVDLNSPVHETDTYQIQLPEGYTVDDMPNPVKIDVGFASYQSRCEYAGSTVKYWREYIVKDPLVPQAKLADLHRLEDAIGGDEYSTVVLKKK
ncbi:MAG TPA: transglutaminase, partial [Terriglobales bacterium]|nr:transglutaminase [Terriglobales bacterium]